MDNCEAYRGLADFAELLSILGDREKLSRAWEAYVVPRAAGWYCAEAASFVLTAARLLRA